MIEAKDLRIGNWVSEEFIGNSQVVSILRDNMIETEYDDMNSAGEKVRVLDTADLCHIFPILITEEWHKKFGASNNRFGNIEYVLPRRNNMNIVVTFFGDYIMLKQSYSGDECDVVSIWNKDLTRRDMYVHEWQNLYYALTGEELVWKQ